ncbi:MAG: PDZ domain-containing protein [Treponema sp.]|nr:PDZ domain-containing protein [Treponema sp.]MBQ7167145.1 PDZ domain-containing protein [Treponema sp.]
MLKKSVLLFAFAAVLLSASQAAGLSKLSPLRKFYEEYEPLNSIPGEVLLGKKEKPVLYYDTEGDELQKLRQSKYYKVTGASGWTVEAGYPHKRKNKSWRKEYIRYAQFYKQKNVFISSEKLSGGYYTHRAYLLRPYTAAEMSEWKFGLETRSLTEAESKRLSTDSGARVTVAFDGYPAQRAGIQRGDIIIQMNDIQIRSMDDLVSFEAAAQKGSSVSVRLVRKGREKVITLGI